MPDLHSQVAFPNSSPIRGTTMALPFPLIGSLDLNSPPVTSRPPVRRSNHPTRYQSLSTTRHLHTLSDLLGQPILSSSNIARISSTSGPFTSDLL